VTGRPKRRATIRELAEYTGLSPAAVSYALRGMHVAPETEERVREAAAELGYEADPVARALRGGATGMVGLLMGSLSDFWNQELAHAIQRELRAADLSTLVADADGEPERELEMARRLLDHRVDGLIVMPIGPAGSEWESLAEEVPIVTVGDALPGVAAAGAVVFDNDSGVERTLRHFSELGHQRLAVLSWAVETSPGRPAERAVERHAQALGLDTEIVPCAYSLNGSRPLALELLKRDDHPGAVFCLSESIAYGVYVACEELGRAIPGDVAVAGYGDHPISRLLAPPLTSTVWDVGHVARAATDLALSAIDPDAPDRSRREVCTPVLIPRESTGTALARPSSG
jgi:DNA-binding LacI/PurR family transcriptional regulator